MRRARWRAAAGQAAALAALATLPAAGAWVLAPGKPAWIENADGTIEPRRAVELGAGVLWIDARVRKEFDRGHIDGALLLNEDEWDAQLPALLERWNPGQQRAVVYCDGGVCQASRQVAARLRDAGIAPVSVLRGGWPEWRKETGR